MKRLLPLMAVIALLTACAGNVTVETKVTDAPTISLYSDSKTLFNYQGFAELTIKNTGEVSRIEVKDLKHDESKPGMFTIHKGGEKYFSPSALKNIRNEAKAGVKYDAVTFSGNEIARRKGSSYIKLQYLIMDVPSDVKKKGVQRETSFNVNGFDKAGKQIFSREIKLTLP